MARVVVWFTFTLVSLLTAHGGSSVIVEIGQSTSLQCKFDPKNVGSITWQLFDGSTFVPISTCKTSETKCGNLRLPSYEGTISPSTGSIVFGLSVNGAKKNETEFSCLADNGERTNISMEVYAWPTKPVCSQDVSTAYINYTCVADNVYPSVNAVMIRKDGNATQGDKDPILYSCTYVENEHDSSTGYSASCTWVLLYNATVHNLTFYVDMSANVSNETQVNRIASASDDIITQLRFPDVALVKGKCPLSSDSNNVRGDAIRVFTMATCTCALTSSGQPPGYVMWYKNNTMISFNRDGSPLNFTYFGGDENTYECRPGSYLQGSGISVNFTPTYFSTAPRSTITGLQSIVIVLGSLCSWLVSHTF